MSISLILPLHVHGVMARLATNTTEQCAQKRGWWLDSIAATAWTPPCGTHTALPLCLWPAVVMDSQMGGDDDDEYEDLYVVLELPEVHSSFLSSCETYVHWLACGTTPSRGAASFTSLRFLHLLAPCLRSARRQHLSHSGTAAPRRRTGLGGLTIAKGPERQSDRRRMATLAAGGED